MATDAAGLRGFRDLEFQERMHRLVDLLLSRQHAWKTEEHVQRHLYHGLVRRLYMLEHSIRILAALPPDRSAALPLHTVREADVALNALFLNIRGSLDNAAWALVYHLSLIPEANEDRRQHRTLAQLFGRRFLAALSVRDPELAERLAELAEWGRNLASVRDPAAHRIPLYIPPSILDEAGAKKVGEIDKEMTAAAERGDWDEFHLRMMDRWNAGLFRPVVALSEQERLALVSLPGVLNRDLGGLLDAVELVVAFVFAEDARPLATNVGPLPTRKRKRP